MDNTAENFDVEKWRIENPMDYIKAMDFINQAPNKDEVFRIIYKIVRLHIPNLLYKYYSLDNDINLNELKLETLIGKKIYMADAKLLNDPFDSKAFFYRADELKKFDRLVKHEGRLIDDFSSFQKIAALTENGVNSMPMWAHYSNNHSGYCLSYDMQDTVNIELSSSTFPVQYTDTRIDVTELMTKQAEMLCEAIDKHTRTISDSKIIWLNDLSMVYMQCLLCNIKHSS